MHSVLCFSMAFGALIILRMILRRLGDPDMSIGIANAMRLVRYAGALTTLLVAPVAVAQTPEKIDTSRFPMGLMDSSTDWATKVPRAVLTRAYIPEAIDLSASFPTPGQQEHGSCVAWATGYAARSYYARSETGNAAHPRSNIPSPAYIFNNTYNKKAPGGCTDAGSNFQGALEFLKSNGAYSLAEYGTELTCKTGHALDQRTPGKFHIQGYELVSLLRHRAFNIDLVRQRIAAGHPVLVGMKVDKAFTELKPGATYAGRGPLTEHDEKTLGGHAMVIVGYDDRRRAFRLINSWDQTWGDGGFAWVSYEAAANQITDSFVMKTGQTPPTPAPSRPTSAPSLMPNMPDYVQKAPCADVRISFIERQGKDGKSANYPRFSGFVSRKADLDTLNRERSTNSENEVALRPWPVCEALLHLREPLGAPSSPTVTTLSGKQMVKVGDTFGFKITTGDNPSFLYAFYLEDDGTVVNLMPRQGAIRPMTQAKTVILLGDGQNGRPTYRATPLKNTSTRETGERGFEAIVVIAGRAPIDELELLENPDAGVYRGAARAAADGNGPPDRLMLSAIRDIMQRRADPNQLQREVGAAVLQIQIEE